MGETDPRGDSADQSAEVDAQTQGANELSEPYFPSAQPAQPEPGKEAPTPSAAQLPGQPPATGQTTPGTAPSAPAPTAAAGDVPKKWTVGGKEYTFEELEKAGLLDKLDVLNTQAQQAAHYQQLFERERQAREAIEANRQQPQAGDAGPSTEQILTFFKPQIDDAVKSGAIEEDVAVLYPKVTSRMMFLSDIQQHQGQRLAEITQWIQSLSQAGRSQQVNSAIHSLSDEVARVGPMYADLAKPEERTKFWNWVGQTINPPANTLNADLVRRMFAAYKSQEWEQAAQATVAAQQATEEEKRRNAMGEGGGVRPAALPEPDAELKGVLDMAQDFLPPLRR